MIAPKWRSMTSVPNTTMTSSGPATLPKIYRPRRPASRLKGTPISASVHRPFTVSNVSANVAEFCVVRTTIDI